VVAGDKGWGQWAENARLTDDGWAEARPAVAADGLQKQHETPTSMFWYGLTAGGSFERTKEGAARDPWLQDTSELG
jgi:hypothetical protein